MSLETNILPLIPQRPPFVMVEKLHACDASGGATAFTVKEENIFVKDGRLTEPALIENIAQTAAARMGYLGRSSNQPAPVGYIGAVQQVQIYSLPETGDVLHTTVKIKNQVFNATIIEGVIRVGNKEIARCEMKIFVSG